MLIILKVIGFLLMFSMMYDNDCKNNFITIRFSGNKEIAMGIYRKQLRRVITWHYIRIPCVIQQVRSSQSPFNCFRRVWVVITSLSYFSYEHSSCKKIQDFQVQIDTTIQQVLMGKGNSNFAYMYEWYIFTPLFSIKYSYISSH